MKHLSHISVAAHSSFTERNLMSFDGGAEASLGSESPEATKETQQQLEEKVRAEGKAILDLIESSNKAREDLSDVPLQVGNEEEDFNKRASKMADTHEFVVSRKITTSDGESRYEIEVTKKGEPKLIKIIVSESGAVDVSFRITDKNGRALSEHEISDPKKVLEKIKSLGGELKAAYEERLKR